MKSIIIFSLLLFPIFISCQLTTNDNLSEEFNKSKDLFPKSIIEWFNAMKNDAPTLALVIKYKVDTLNLDQIKLPDYSNITILSLNGKPNNEKENTEEKEWKLIDKDILWTGAQMKDDTLIIDIGAPFGHEFIQHKVYGDNFTVKYEEHYKKEPMLKLKLEDTLTSEINIPIKVNKFELSSLIFKSKDKIHGYCDFETEPYFFVGRNLKTGILFLKKRFVYYFETRIAN